ncbi:MAG: hypothetical protein ABI553_09430 [Chloroflexota bacterium]
MTFDQDRSGGPEPFSPTTPEPPRVPTQPVAAVQPVAVQPSTRPAGKGPSGGRLLNVVLVIAAAVAVGGVAFAVGRSTAPVSATTGNGRGGAGFGPGGSFAPRASGQAGFGGRGGFGGAGGTVTLSGTVVSMTADTLTLKTAAGQTIEVAVAPATTYDTQAPAAAADVQAGKTVEVQLQFGGIGGGAAGSRASGVPSGSIGTANSITVVP